MLIKIACILCSTRLFWLCAGVTNVRIYERIFTAYNPLLDDYKLTQTTCDSVNVCSMWCWKNQACVSFIFDRLTSMCIPFSEYAECEIGEIIDSFYIIKGRQPRLICECNIAYNESFVNVALNKSVEYSSIYSLNSDFHPDYLTDGNHNTLAVTGLGVPYAIVDLQDTYDIFSFFIANRIDCCPERLRNFKLLASDDQITWTECIYYPNAVGIDCTLRAHTPCIGRFVKLHILYTTFLQLRELEVFILL